jgi:DNA-binding beta-propeller fold protein YncE
LILAGCAGASPAAATARSDDWTRFGYDAARTNAAPQGLGAHAVRRLVATRVTLPGTVDSSPIYLSGVQVGGQERDLLVVTTSYGITLGLDPGTGQALWQYTPPSYQSVVGTYQISPSSPVADPSGKFVYAPSSAGLIHKLSTSDGTEVADGNWPARIDANPAREKVNSSLNLAGHYVLATTGGYFDTRPYQGTVVAVDRRTGTVARVFNAMCSDRDQLFDPSTCRPGSSIWGRAGAVVDPVTHRVYATTANGNFDGTRYWGDSVLELAPGLEGLRRHYTPRDERILNRLDHDLGSTSPALLPAPNGGPRARYLLQGGKDGRLRLLRVGSSLHSVKGSTGRRLGGEVQTLPTPGGAAMFTAPAVLHRPGSTRVFVATAAGIRAYRLARGRLHVVWHAGAGGTSPVVAGNLVWVFQPKGALNVYRAGNGQLVRRMRAPAGHWNSPIVAGGRAYLPTGNANDVATNGSLSIYHAP